jgi:eukaryotic-like serine/threonine-protein kinase
MSAQSVLDRLTSSLAERYALEREIGQGGMATVFLARDLRHERRVAIKVLHPELSAMLGPDRFLSEIKLTASLQHPHILPLFDSGVADGLLYYVMPFVEGETLRARLERERQLPVADAVRLAREIADALHYAHERGVVHRDIKPENVLLQSGRAVVADFGIALAVQQAGGTRMTQTGMSLGTPHYMAPEQAMGERNVDARADVYALGAMTYEMLAGEPPFTGPTAQAIVARVMTERPRSLHTVRDTVPAHVETAVNTALEKLPADRFSTAAQFASALEIALATPNTSGARQAPVTPTRGRGARIALIGVIALVVGALLGAFGMSQRGGTTTAVAALPLKFSVVPPDSVALRLICCGQLFAISPDGRWLVMQGTQQKSGNDSGNTVSRYSLYLRDLTELSTRKLPDTDSATSIFFSPTGDEIGFVRGRQIYRLALSGSEAQPVAELPEGFVAGGSWGEDNQIVMAVSNRMLQVPVSGGTPTVLFESGSPDEQFGGPQRFSREQVILHTTGGFTHEPQIVWRSLATGKSHVVVNGATPTYLPEQRALLVVRSDGALLQYPFDLAAGDTTGPGVRIANNVTRRSPIVIHGEYSASRTGTVVLATRGDARLDAGAILVELAQGATPKRILSEFSSWSDVFIDPTGSRALVTAAMERGAPQVPYLYDLQRNLATRISIDGTLIGVGWTRGGDSLLYATSPGEILAVALEGARAPRSVLKLRGWSASASHMSVSGPWIAFTGVEQGDSSSVTSIVVAHRDSSGAARRLDPARFAQTAPSISPDGRWIAYVSRENGRDDVFVSRFPVGDGRYLVSPRGGTFPSWSTDSRTIFFQVATQIMATNVAAPSASPNAAPVIDAPRVVYSRAPWALFDITPDGKTLLFVDRVREGDPRTLIVSLNAVARP